MKAQRVCVVGPKDPLAPVGLGFDFGPLLDTISQTGQKYLQAGIDRRAAKTQEAEDLKNELARQRQVMAVGAGGVGGGLLVMMVLAGIFLLSRRR